MSYSQLVQQLCDKHYKREIDFDQYRRERREVLDKIDQEHNGAKRSESASSQVLKGASFDEKENLHIDDEDKTITFTNHTQRKN